MTRATRARVARCTAVAVAALIAMVAAARPAAAFERQHHLGVGGGVSILKVGDKDSADVGAGIALHYAYGLTDQFNLLVEGQSSIVSLNEATGPKIPPTRPGAVDNLSIGAGYVLDVVRLVPYAGVLVGPYALTGGSLGSGNVKWLAGAQLAVGVDYQLTRNFAFGLAVRQHVLTDPSTYPSFTNVFLRGEYVWGW